MNADGPVTLEGASEPHCSSGVYITDPVTATRGMVCSSFIWTAVQIANRSAKPKILLDGRPTFPEPPASRDDVCTQLTKAHGRARIAAGSLDTSNPVDGLYFYGPKDRANAATALQKKLVDKVMENIGDFMDTVAGPPLLGAFFGGATGMLISEMLALNPPLLALILGTTTAYVDGEIQKIRDTAYHLSNQMGDTFRKDNSAEDNESDDWVKNPGTGNAVSPDDILNSWSAPHYEDDDRVAGVYGSNIVAEVLSPAPVDGKWEFTTLEVSTDVAQILVRVFYRDAVKNQVFVANARVRIGGCPDGELITHALSDMTAGQSCGPIWTGTYYGRATWTDPVSTFQWRGPRRIVEVPGPMVDFEVFPPKETRRKVRIFGTADLLNRHATDEIPVIGTDPWVKDGQGFDSGWILMGMDFANINPADDPEFYAWLEDNYGSDLHGLSDRTWPWEAKMEDWGFARVKFRCQLDPTGKVSLTVTGGMRKGTDETDNTEPEWGDDQHFDIRPKKISSDPNVSFDFTVERTGFGYPPVRATLHVTVANEQQGG
jgi:hypothetical protein